MTAGQLFSLDVLFTLLDVLFTFNMNFLCNLQNGKSHGLETGDTNSSLAQQLDQTIQPFVPWPIGDLGIFNSSIMRFHIPQIKLKIRALTHT